MDELLLENALETCEYVEDACALFHFVLHPRYGASNVCRCCYAPVQDLTQRPDLKPGLGGHEPTCSYVRTLVRVREGETLEQWLERQ